MFIRNKIKTIFVPSRQIMFQASFITDSPPDSIEWCPNRSDVFACGTYLYNPENTTREGSIYLCRYDALNKTIDILQHQKSTGVLDLKWIECTPENLFLSTVTALGQLSLYSPTDLTQPLISEAVTNDQTIALSQSWFHHDNNHYALISDQQGYLNICELTGNNGLRFSQSWLAHEYECWTCAWDQYDPNIVYSGADDTLLKIWDIRQCQTPTHINRKHPMGICSININEKNSNEFLTGSFDEYLRQWDKRNLTNPIKTVKLGGGVWKIRAHPCSTDQLLLCACMHNGFVIINLTTEMIVCHYKEHSSLAYGCDWQCKEVSTDPLPESMDEGKDIRMENVIVSCSFYDKTVHVWKQQT